MQKPVLRISRLTLSRKVTVVVLFAVWLAGCSTLTPRGPVAENVIAAQRLSQQGMEAVQQRQWDRAEAFFRRAVVTCPTDVRARQHYAQTLWHRGAVGDAITSMEEAVRLSGGDPVLLVSLGEMYLSRGDMGRAERRVERAIRANPALAEAWALQGDILRQRGMDHEALAAYHRALSSREDYPRVQLEVAELYRRQNRPQRALATLQCLAEQYPPNEEPGQVLLLKGLALKAMGRYDDAVQCLTLAAERDEPTADVYYHLGDAELLAGRPARARLAVRKALAIQPQHPLGLALLRRIDRQQERMAAAGQRW